MRSRLALWLFRQGNELEARALGLELLTFRHALVQGLSDVLRVVSRFLSVRSW